MALYKGGIGKDKTGKVKYIGPSFVNPKGFWIDRYGRVIPGPQRKYGDRDDKYRYNPSKGRYGIVERRD